MSLGLHSLSATTQYAPIEPPLIGRKLSSKHVSEITEIMFCCLSIPHGQSDIGRQRGDKAREAAEHSVFSSPLRVYAYW